MIKSYKLRRHIANAFVYLFLIVMGFVWISPFIYLLMHSFRGGAEVYGSTIIPQEWTFQNYIDLFTGSGGTASLNFPRWFLNTFVVACFSCVISTISVLMVSYAFSRLRFKARKKFMNVGMILGMFPGFMTMIAIYYLLKAMGLTQTLVALVICYSCGAGLGFQISKGFFDTIPRALDEAATIDGATKNQIFWKIILPVSKPGIVTACIFLVINSWNELLFANLLNQSDSSRTIQVAIRSFLTTFEANYAYAFAAMVISILPTIIIYALLTDRIIGGMTAGAVKG